MSTDLAQRLADVRAAVDAAARRAHRDPAAVTVVVVTKEAPPSIFGELAGLGVRDVGENRIPAALERMAGWEPRFRWHFVGHVQSNKARKVLERFDVLHGIDSAELVGRIDRLAGELGRRPELLLQVNVSGEGAKAGLQPDQVPEALEAAAACRHARVVGLMTMAPLVEESEQARPVFAGLAALRDRLAGRPGAPPLPELSMGMTNDFEVAVEEGATLVRIGRRIVAPHP